ncbi:hypothetical protein FSP39_002214 [Pinctada imbricata]|uniref:EF-hand domain-containing protein n=1 Tax=Pinctada imbricata TaxID=66713 RepID=A0AA88Y646_PINIB|nr:hypothetical protein FSP39_002214 [Pinctada imbricata]
MDRSVEADYLIFRMGEREKTFFARLGISHKTEKPKQSMFDIVRQMIEAKLNPNGFVDASERLFFKKHCIPTAPLEQKPRRSSQTVRNIVQNGKTTADDMTLMSARSVPDSDLSTIFERDAKSDNVNMHNENGIDKGESDDIFNEDSIDNVTRNLLQSSHSRVSASSRRMRPAWLERRDTVESDDFNFDENEEVPLKYLKNQQSHKIPITKTTELYKVACVLCGVVPLASYIRQVTTNNVNLRCSMLVAKSIKPIAISLVRDEKVLYLDVSENNIGALGVMYIAEMLTTNTYITELNLNCTYPGKEGLKVLAETLAENTSVKILRLEGNKIQHTETHLITDIIENVRTLKELYLGHNAIGHDGGCQLAKCLETNTTLRILDIQWNHIRRQSASALCKALAENVGLRSLELSWNGLGKEGCIALASSLPKNKTLKTLSINSNRVDMLSLRFLLHGLVRNEGLKILRMGGNPVTTDGAKAVLRAVQSSKICNLEQVDLEDISVDERFEEIMKKLFVSKGVKVSHGEIINFGNKVEEKPHDPHDLTPFEPVLVLVEYMRIDNLRLIDFFQYLDTSSRDRLSKSDLRDGVANLGIPLTEHHLDLVMEKVDLKQDGYIDLEEFMAVHREVSRQVTTRTTKAKQKGKEDEGLVSLRKILRDIVEKRNKANKEKASNKHSQGQGKGTTQGRDRVIAKNKSLTVTKPTFSRDSPSKAKAA